MTNSQNASTSKALASLQRKMAREHAASIARGRTPEAEKYRSAQNALLKTVKDIGRSGDIDTIIAAEKAVLDNEKRLYGNSSGMNASLDTAMMELFVANPLSFFMLKNSSRIWPSRYWGRQNRDPPLEGISPRKGHRIDIARPRGYIS
ncbi:hypothetical protein [Varunaivibrio sulfuroxidans]|uniref:Uncharacterized protein n=1 Tax=Varunaivibrio sulfuroxidans TaxID=1773489 RepID=A0A4R3J470_9PROT|nr:hypothetical protein [Varunaivibrio sulfuroxidans]TCS59954.1 hypothetical protein EDD55_1145 [Varunaivibrio sulfuroxidans]WES31762.1 hypothetical protein P3M64_05185 [Varunaivibrio sulfuroxidans]